MAFDFKKEYRKFYCPKNKPAIVDIPAMNYIAVRGEGDPILKTASLRLSPSCTNICLIRVMRSISRISVSIMKSI